MVTQPLPEQTTNEQPVAAQLAPEQITQIRASNKQKFTWGMICLIAPTALLFITIVCYAVINFVAESAAPSGNAIEATPSNAQTIVNIIMFLIGAVATLTWLPGIIVGIVLLSKRQRV